MDDDAGKGAQGEKDFEPIPLLKSPLVTKAPFIVIMELCERLAYYGIATNIITYVTGVLGYTSSAASSAVMAWSGTCYFTPIIGAFLADAYMGRFKVILWFSSVFYVPGLILLAISAGVPELHPAEGQKADTGQLAVFWIAMYFIAMGMGGNKERYLLY